MNVITAILGASFRTSFCGLVLIAAAIWFFAHGKDAEGGISLTTGIALLNTRDATVSTEKQKAEPGPIQNLLETKDETTDESTK